MDDTDNRHIIKRQVLEVEIQGQPNAEAAQQEFRRVFHADLLPFISQILDQYSPPNMIHRIERLEIDLGEVPLQTMGQEIERKFKAYFAKRLVQAIQRAEAQTSFVDQSVVPQSEVEFHIKEEMELSPEGERPAVSLQSDAELFFYFLETGRLPWWAKAIPNLLNEVTKRLLANGPGLMAKLMIFIEQEPYRKRMICHLSDSLLIQLAKTLPPHEQPSDLLHFLGRLPSLAKQLADQLQISQVQIRYSLWEVVFVGVLEQGGQLNFNRNILLNISQQLITQFKLSEKVIKEVLLQSDILDKFTGLVDGSGHSIKPEASGKERKIPSTENQEQAKPLPLSKLFASSEAVYIDNAGLVILWVFLTNFFDHLEWVSERGFKNAALQHRAVWALQYMADGQVAPPEYILALNKILCGLAVEEPLEPQDPLSEQEQSACDELLAAVLTHAEALGQISPEGFQQSFLQREGILTYKENRWLLQVKKETYDILLNRLNWNYQIVKLPWMNTAIFVEW